MCLQEKGEGLLHIIKQVVDFTQSTRLSIFPGSLLEAKSASFFNILLNLLLAEYSAGLSAEYSAEEALVEAEQRSK